MTNVKTIWRPLYKQCIGKNIPEDESDIFQKLINFYINLKKVKNDDIDRDRKIGYTGIIQEEFCFTVYLIPY